MKKIIAAILAVICVHVGFSTLVSTEPAAEQTAAAVKKLPDLDVLPVSSVSELDEAPAAQTFSAELAENLSNSTARPVRVVEKIVYVPRIVRMPEPKTGQAMSRNSTVALFQPVVITPASMPLSSDIGERRTVNVDVSKTHKKTEKRSLMAKALPIIKKPWDWLKFVGSRLK